MYNLLLFGGTTEGRRLEELLCGEETVRLTVCVATGYGESLLQACKRVRILSGRLDAAQIEALLGKERFDLVVDATHPYAVAVTKNLKSACKRANTRYLRLLREQGAKEEGCIPVSSAREAAEFLNSAPGNALLTTGSKELDVFTGVSDYRERLYPRVLPLADVVGRCLSLGYPVGRLIAMQGPFSEELNTAMLRQVKASFLVTKDSGGAGGFGEKIRAAKRAGARVVLIERPEEEGLSFSQVADLLRSEFHILEHWREIR